MATDGRQQLQRDLEDAYRRGQLDETVRSVQSRLAEITESIKELQMSVSDLTKATVSTKRFEALEVSVEGLERWKWRLIGVLGGLVALLQIIPVIWKLARGAP